jgi:hypothetical protein
LALRTERGGLLRVVSGRGERAHGQTDSLMRGDEVWCWTDESLLEAFLDGAREARRGAARADLDGRIWAALAGVVAPRTATRRP